MRVTCLSEYSSGFFSHSSLAPHTVKLPAQTGLLLRRLRRGGEKQTETKKISSTVGSTTKLAVPFLPAFCGPSLSGSKLLHQWQRRRERTSAHTTVGGSNLGAGAAASNGCAAESGQAITSKTRNLRWQTIGQAPVVVVRRCVAPTRFGREPRREPPYR